MKGYRKKIEASVKAAIDDGVHYANIVTIPAYCVGDIAHHISQSTFNMCKDDVIMATIEAATEVMDLNLRNAVPRYRNEYDILFRLRPVHRPVLPSISSNLTVSMQ